MAIKSLNSVGGFSVKDVSGTIVVIIDDNGNVNTPDLTVTGISNLGSNANVKITGGNSGQVLSTDGAGNLSWSSGGGGSGFFSVYTRTGTVIVNVSSGILTIVGRSGNVNVYVT